MRLAQAFIIHETFNGELFMPGIATISFGQVLSTGQAVARIEGAIIWLSGYGVPERFGVVEG